MFVPALLWSGIISGTQVTNVSPGVLAWEASRMFTLIAPQVASEASKVLTVRGWTSVWNAIRSSLEHLHPVSVEPGGTSTAAASVRDRLSPTREGKLWCKVYLHPHLEQGGTPPVERWRWELTIPASLLWTVSWKTGIDLIPRDTPGLPMWYCMAAVPTGEWRTVASWRVS